ncbi:hypothetical protein GTY41_30585, partial [Streptomyces sp. SID685]|uniref:hypothetical protein n=1 Tax=Streptomyces sp. SID685 TaxID=2690322 RepID=UPI001369529E
MNVANSTTWQVVARMNRRDAVTACMNRRARRDAIAEVVAGAVAEFDVFAGLFGAVGACADQGGLSG